tara:strand:- start:203 stop:412 length:210 start_codon:yes stop_codon:yes gene_type:complete
MIPTIESVSTIAAERELERQKASKFLVSKNQTNVAKMNLLRIVQEGGIRLGKYADVHWLLIGNTPNQTL